MMILICVKQHLSNIWISGHEKVKWHLRWVEEKRCLQKACICKGDGSYGWDYIGENKNDKEVRWNKHNNATKSPEPTKQLKSSIDHCFT